MKGPVLLTFNLPEAKAAKLRLLCMRFAIRFQPVPAAEWGQTLGALCGLTERTDAPAPEETFTEEVLVMAMFPAGLAQQLLMAMKRAKLPPVALKAILTLTNSAWTPVELYDELCKEREAIQAGKPRVHEAETPQPKASVH